MRLVQQGKAVFRFRKLAAMPFGFTVETLAQALPFFLASALLLLLPAIKGALFARPQPGDFEGLLFFLMIAGLLACQAAIFSTTLTVAVRRLLPQTGAVPRVASLWPVAQKAWPQFFDVLVGLLTFGFLFSILMGLPFQSALSELRATGDIAAALRSFAWHVVLEFINPWFWLAGFVAGYYFRNAAKRAIILFEAILDGFGLRVPEAKSLTYIVDKNRQLFASLVSVPHFLFGLAFSFGTSFAPVAHLTGLLEMGGDHSNGLLPPLAASVAMSLLIGTLFSLVAGFIAVIWLAAAQAAGVVDNAITAEAGFGKPSAAPEQLPGSKPRPQTKPLAGSGPVVRRSGWWT
jgi:hypothetical protein